MGTDPDHLRCEANVAKNLSYVCVTPAGGRGGAMSSVSMDFGTGATLVQRFGTRVPFLFNTACLILHIIRFLFTFSTTTQFKNNRISDHVQETGPFG